MGGVPERCIQKWPAVREGQIIMEYWQNPGEPKAEWGQRAASWKRGGRRECKKHWKGNRQGVETNHFHELASDLYHLEEIHGLLVKSKASCICMLLIIPSQGCHCDSWGNEKFDITSLLSSIPEYFCCCCSVLLAYYIVKIHTPEKVSFRRLEA